MVTCMTKGMDTSSIITQVGPEYLSFNNKKSNHTGDHFWFLKVINIPFIYKFFKDFTNHKTWLKGQRFLAMDLSQIDLSF